MALDWKGDLGLSVLKTPTELDLDVHFQNMLHAQHHPDHFLGVMVKWL
jgi:hypothetical protein